jgi:hypothetical protein
MKAEIAIPGNPAHKLVRTNSAPAAKRTQHRILGAGVGLVKVPTGEEWYAMKKQLEHDMLERCRNWNPWTRPDLKAYGKPMNVSAHYAELLATYRPSGLKRTAPCGKPCQGGNAPAKPSLRTFQTR